MKSALLCVETVSGRPDIANSQQNGRLIAGSQPANGKTAAFHGKGESSRPGRGLVGEEPRDGQTLLAHAIPVKVAVAAGFLGVKVSVAADAFATATEDATVGDLLDAIKAGRWQVEVERIRAEYARGGKAACAALKKELPAILWSGRFSTREKRIPLAKKLLAHSGILCADLDELGDRITEVRSAIQKCPCAFAAFLSPTGTGLKVLFKVKPDADSHLESFQRVKQLVRELTGCGIDGSCKDVQRLCFVSFDPRIWIRNGEPTEVDVKQNTCTSRTSRTHTVSVSLGVGAGCQVPPYPSRRTTPKTCVRYRHIFTIKEAVELACPTQRRTNHRRLYMLAGALKAFEKTKKVSLTKVELRAAFKQWYRGATKWLDPAMSEQKYHCEFWDAWSNIKSPLCESLLDRAWKNSTTAPPPREAIAGGWTDPDIVRVIAFCRELQTLTAPDPFSLSPYVLAKLLGQKHHSTAASWLNAFCLDGILTKKSRGNFKQGRASSFRYNSINHHEKRN